MGTNNVLFTGLVLLGLLFATSSAFFYEEYIIQLLNPIDSFDRRTWQNRYFVDKDSYREGGPIFVHLGGPDFYLTDARMNLSHFFEMGLEMGALMVYTEHRFYGASRPTNNTSLVNMQYLDTRLALADVANLLTYLKSQYGDAPVIAHGYDHSGALAVWLKQRYPQLVDGVWASSATLHARKDFGEFLVNIGLAVRKVGGDQCYTNLETAFTNMGNHYDRGEYSILERHFDVCVSFTPNDRVEEAEFFAFYALAIAEILRYSHAYGIEVLCDFLDDHEDPMEGLAEFARLTIPTCAPLQGYSQLYLYLEEDWDTLSTEYGMRQLAYQVCREFGWFKTSSYFNQPFGSRFPVELFQDQCRFIFGPVFNPSSILHMMDNTNEMFGGYRPNVTRVYFTDGDLDPAKTLGIQEPFGEEIYVDIIPNFAAGAEILISSVVTSDDVRNVQLRAKELITQWIQLARSNK